MDHELYNTIAHTLLFSSTYNPLPVASVIDMKIKESLEKSGSAKNAAFWNWKSLQKNLLDADLPRVIMTSHWSTGKTRILFMKALMLARDGKFVVLVLHYSQLLKPNVPNDDKSSSVNEKVDEAAKLLESGETAPLHYFSDHAPILLYHSLMNEIDQEKAEVKEKIKLMVSKDLHEDLVKNDSLTGDVHIFIDEFVVNGVDDLKTLDEVCEKIDVKNHAWVAVAKVSALHSESFKKWLEEKHNLGWLEPSLKFKLRNTKEIIAFENSLAPQEKSLALKDPVASSTKLQPAVDSNPDPEGLSNPNFESQLPLPVSTNRLKPYDLPTQGWPFADLSIPDNLCDGKKVHVEIHKTSEPLEDAMKQCFKVLNNVNRVLIVVLAEEISLELITLVEKTRQQKPLVLDENSKLDSELTGSREYQLLVREWLINPAKTQDLIASSCVMAGFEWPSILMITSKNHKSQFYARNMVMRAMSSLVWLKTDSLKEYEEL